MDYVHRLFAPVALKFPVGAPTGVPWLLQPCHGRPTLNPGVESRHSHVSPSSQELSAAGIIKRHSIDIYVVRHNTKGLRRNGVLPPLASLILYSITGIRYHMPFVIKKDCRVRIHSVCWGVQPQHLRGRNFIILFEEGYSIFSQKYKLCLDSKAKPQQHNIIMFWTPKTDWLTELKTWEEWRRHNQKLN